MVENKLSVQFFFSIWSGIIQKTSLRSTLLDRKAEFIMKKGYIFYLAISISASSMVPIADTALMSWQDKVRLIPDPTNSDIRVLSHRKVVHWACEKG